MLSFTGFWHSAVVALAREKLSLSANAEKFIAVQNPDSGEKLQRKNLHAMDVAVLRNRETLVDAFVGKASNILPRFQRFSKSRPLHI